MRICDLSIFKLAHSLRPRVLNLPSPPRLFSWKRRRQQPATKHTRKIYVKLFKWQWRANENFFSFTLSIHTRFHFLALTFGINKFLLFGKKPKNTTTQTEYLMYHEQKQCESRMKFFLNVLFDACEL